MRTLIVFWHGIGDCIMATPAFRQYHEEHPDEDLYFALCSRPFDSGFFRHCDYVSGTFCVRSPWEYPSYREGLRKVRLAARSLAAEKHMDKVIHVDLRAYHAVNKTMRAFYELGLKSVRRTHREVYVSPADERAAKAWLKKQCIGRFVFMHRKSSTPEKDLPKGMADAFVKKEFKDCLVVEPGISYDVAEHDINFSFALLKLSAGVVVVDSAFLHAATSLKQKIDFAYFNFFAGASEQTRPLDGVVINVVKGPVEQRIYNRIAWSCKKLLIVSMSSFYRWRL